MYKHPGVYIEHVPSGALAIEAASTSTAVFVGAVRRGPPGEPVLILNRGEFVDKFGELNDEAGGIRDMVALGESGPDYFGHAVSGFYANGGRKAYIMRLLGANAAKATGAVVDRSSGGNQALYLTAANEGAWANTMVAKLGQVDDADATLGYLLELGYEVPGAGAEPDFIAFESYAGVDMDPNGARFVDKIVNSQSALVTCERKAVGVASGGERLQALRSGSLRTLNFNDLKEAVLRLTVNGSSVHLTFAADLSTVTAVLSPGAPAEESNVATPDSPVSSLFGLAEAVEEAVQGLTGMDRFSAAQTDDNQLLLVPPPVAAPGSATITSTAAPGGAAEPDGRIVLAFDTATTLNFPGQDKTYFINGADGDAPGQAQYDAAFLTMRDYRDMSIVLLPGQVWGADPNNPVNTIIQSAIAHAEYMKNRVVVVDPADPSVSASRLNTGKDVKDKKFPTSTFSALYYPWLEAPNPHYDADTAPNRERSFAVPPSAFAAGLWARIDGSRGVWKAPAGLEATVRGALGPNLLIGNDRQDQLNEWGVNCIRNIIGPSVIWGARTLATKVKPDQRYVPVRRTSAMIGESLYNALQAVVFEPNKHVLWAALRAGAGDFMDQLFRAGAFQGEKASEAYYVRCGLNSTMTQADIDSGIVRLVVGYAPLKPAEFVVVQIKQIVGQRG